MDTLYWKFLFIQHHCRICSRKKRRNMVGVSESGKCQNCWRMSIIYIFGRWTWHSPRDHEWFKSRCSDAGRMSCSLLLPTRRWKSGRFCAADLDSRTVSRVKMPKNPFWKGENHICLYDAYGYMIYDCFVRNETSTKILSQSSVNCAGFPDLKGLRENVQLRISWSW